MLHRSIELIVALPPQKAIVSLGYRSWNRVEASNRPRNERSVQVAREDVFEPAPHPISKSLNQTLTKQIVPIVEKAIPTRSYLSKNILLLNPIRQWNCVCLRDSHRAYC